MTATAFDEALRVAASEFEQTDFSAAAFSASDFSATDFRATLAHHASGVAVITVAGEPAPAGFTATSFTGVSLEPPLVSFCIDVSASTWPAVQAAQSFAVNLLAADQTAVARQFARSGIDRFAGLAYRRGPHDTVLLDGTLAWLACEPVTIHPAGDHALVVGAVREAGMNPDREPLLYHRQQFRALA